MSKKRYVILFLWGCFAGMLMNIEMFSLDSYATISEQYMSGITAISLVEETEQEKEIDEVLTYVGLDPTNGLDEKGVEVLYRVVGDLKQKGKIILITSHNREDIHVMCDTVYKMREGKLWQEEG